MTKKTIKLFDLLRPYWKPLWELLEKGGVYSHLYEIQFRPQEEESKEELVRV